MSLLANSRLLTPSKAQGDRCAGHQLRAGPRGHSRAVTGGLGALACSPMSKSTRAATAVQLWGSAPGFCFGGPLADHARSGGRLMPDGLMTLTL